VTADNSCGASTARTLAVSVTVIPEQPGAISGETTVCRNSSHTYSISPVSGATSYSWTLPPGWTGSSGTTSIDVTAGTSGGTISVTASNSCSTSSARTLSVLVTTIPDQPGSITGETSVCQGSSQTYSISPVSGATSYSWTLPSGWTGTSNTTSINVTAGLSGGTISVTASNSCGTSSASNLSVSVPENPSAPIAGTLTQPNCAIATGSVVLSGLPDPWTLTRTPGGTVYTGTGTSTTISSLAAATYTFTVTNSAGCTSAASADVVIDSNPSTPSAPAVGTITQPTCDVATGSVVLNGLPATGTWTLTRTPGGTTTTGTGTSSTITELAPGTYTYMVTNEPGCISIASDNVVISMQPETPSAPTLGTVTQPTCDMATGSVVLNGLPASGTWTLTETPGGDTSTGTGTSSTIAELAAGNYTFTVTNETGCISPASADVVINSIPVITGQNDISVLEDNPLTMVISDFTVTDADDPSGPFTLTVNTGTSYSVAGTVITPADNFNGALTVPISVSDGTVSSCVFNATVNVTPVNDAPVISVIPDQTIKQGESFGPVDLDLYVDDIETPNKNILWTYSGNSNLNVTITTRIATITVVNGSWYGTEEITFTATDDDATLPLSDSKTVEFEVIKPTSLTENVDIENISIYPNPTSGTLFISGQNLQSNRIHAEIIDMRGRSVYLDDCESNKGIFVLNVNDLSNGTYVIKLITTKTVYTLKFVKN
jgi:hypothetical protein